MNPKLDDLLKTSELAIIHGKSMRTINRWRHLIEKPSAGYGWGNNYAKRPFKKFHISKKTPVEIVDEKIWNNPNWFREMYEVKKYGMPLIARMTKRSYTAIKLRLRKYGIRIRTRDEANHSCNKYCNPEWLEEMYIINGYPIRKCAKLAGVNPHTIYDWLVKFNFEIRDIYEASYGDNYGNRASNNYPVDKKSSEHTSNSSSTPE